MAMDDIIEAAVEERWDYVDERIPKICNNPSIQDRAVELLNNENPNLRDLGASIIAKAKINPERLDTIRKKLGSMLKDDHPYARYRAAFALAEHGAQGYKPEMLRVLREAEKDPDVGNIAKNYLSRLK